MTTPAVRHTTLPDGRPWACTQEADLRFVWREVFEDRVYADAASSLGAGATVLDVGANTGLSALFFAAQAPDVTIHAFEPARALHACLADNLRLHVPGATAHRLALGASAGTSSFTYYPLAPSNSGLHADPDADGATTRAYLVSNGLTEEDADELVAGLHEPRMETVRVATLSEVLADVGIGRVDLLKVDVERAELDVLLGVGGSDWPRIERAVVEVHDRGEGLERCCTLLAEQGFTVTTHQEDWLAGSELHTLLAVR